MASREIVYKETTFKLAYEFVNNTHKPVLLVLHGWGSNKEIMKQAFGATMNDFTHLYVDMPGFGKSTNGLILATRDYANILQLFLESLDVSPVVAMGHSFGGKVATLLGAPCLVLLSSSGVLVPKPLSVRIKIAIVKLLKPFGFSKIRQLFVAADAQGMSHEMYETFKNVVNEDFEAHFAQTSSHTLLFWGKADAATPLWTAQKIQTLIPHSKLYPLEGDHFFFLNHQAFIAQTISDACKEHIQ